MNFVYINYLPGGGGNFLARALGLNDDIYSFVDPDVTTLVNDVDEKFELYSYRQFQDRTIDNYKSADMSWIQFEYRDLRPALEIFPIPYWEDITAHHVQLRHPEDIDIAGIDDIVYNIAINSDNCYNWIVLNALYKNSSICFNSGNIMPVEWIETYIAKKNDPDSIVIQLEDFLSWDSFEIMFTKLCKDININKIHWEHVKQLYLQWYSVSLMTEDQLDALELSLNNKK